MRKTFLLTLLVSLIGVCAWAKGVSADAGTTMAVLQQTVIQTAEHARQLEEAIQSIQLLQSQVQNSLQYLLES